MRSQVDRVRVGLVTVLIPLVVGVVHVTPAGAVPTILKSAALQVDADMDMQVSPGDTLRYTVQIADTGTANGVNFGDPVPDPNTMLVSGSVTTSQGSVVSGNGGMPPVVVNVGTINNQTITITFDVTIKNPLPATTLLAGGVNQVTNVGFAACDTCGMSNVMSNELLTPVVAAANLTATKTAALQVDADGDMQVSPGDTLRYVVTVTNTGNQDAIAGFSDVPGPNTMLVAGSVTTTLGTIASGNTGGDTAVGVSLGILTGGGGTATVTFDATIKNPLPAGVNQVGNQGGVECASCMPKVSQPTDDPDTATPNDPTLTPVVAAPDVTATKAVAVLTDLGTIGQANPGDVLKYTVVITNSGNQDAAAVIFTDQPSAVSALLAGSVTTTAGAVLTGNNPGDTSVQVGIPVLMGGGGSVTIMFQAQIDADRRGIIPVKNQGDVSGANVPALVTDDPSTAAADDATVIFAVGPAAMPVFSGLGLAFALTLLVGIAAARLRRASADPGAG